MHWTRRTRIGGALLALSACSLGLIGGCSESLASAPVDLRVLLDGETALVLESAVPGKPTPLRELLPAADFAEWKLVEAFARDGRQMRSPDPAKNYSGKELALLYVPGDGLGLGAVPFEADGDLPQQVEERPRSFLDNVYEIHVRTRTQAPEGAAPTPLTLALPDGERVLDAAALAELELLSPRVAQGQSGGKQRQAGYHVGDVVALGADLDAVDSVLVVGRDDASLELAPDVLRSRVAPLPLLKRNRRGAMRLRVWAETGGELLAVDQLQDVHRIEVRLASGQ
ncbi:MAG: hypothetical protein AAF682_31240 [Planctomycetota bacterium]